MQNQNSVHPFETTLGLGPYTVVGFFALVLPSESNQGQSNFHLAPQGLKSGVGTCAHCGRGIINNYIVQIGNGEKYAIGSDCIFKASLPFREISKVRQNELKMARAQRAARKAKKGLEARTELRQILESQKETLSLIPRTAQRSLYQYATWCLDHSSDGGIVLVLRRVKELLQNSAKVL